VPWYNLGLVRKHQRRWPESLSCNLRAAALDPTDEAAWWNAGIAATALGEWATARRAWAAFGIELPPDDGEITMRLGPTPIRLNADGNGEVVWCARIDAETVIALIQYIEDQNYAAYCAHRKRRLRRLDTS
jgi:tetratricopeptide (TPR) repeat protein